MRLKWTKESNTEQVVLDDKERELWYVGDTVDGWQLHRWCPYLGMQVRIGVFSGIRKAKKVAQYIEDMEELA